MSNFFPLKSESDYSGFSSNSSPKFGLKWFPPNEASQASRPQIKLLQSQIGPLRPQIRPLRPQIRPLGPQIRLPRSQIRSFRPQLKPPRPEIRHFRIPIRPKSILSSLKSVCLYPTRLSLSLKPNNWLTSYNLN